jgi:hypothetical protein
VRLQNYLNFPQVVPQELAREWRFPNIFPEFLIPGATQLQHAEACKY